MYDVNQFVTVLINVGVIALILFISSLIYSYWKSRKEKRKCQ